MPVTVSEQPRLQSTTDFEQVQWQPAIVSEDFELDLDTTSEQLLLQLTTESEQALRATVTTEPMPRSPTPPNYTPSHLPDLVAPHNLSYSDPRAIYQRYIAAREAWYKTQPSGTYVSNDLYRKAVHLPRRFSKKSYEWCLDYKQMGKRCITPTGSRDWTKEEMMAYLDWDKAETDRIETQVAQETDNGRLLSGKRVIAELWKRAGRDMEEQEALWAAEQEGSVRT